jgi:hypothetical protein
MAQHPRQRVCWHRRRHHPAQSSSILSMLTLPLSLCFRCSLAVSRLLPHGELLVTDYSYGGLHGQWFSNMPSPGWVQLPKKAVS